MPELPPEFGIEVGGLAAFQTQYAEQGYSATAALDEFRQAGGRIRDADWYTGYGEVRSAIANRDIVTGLDPSSLPSHDQFTEWSGVKPGQYAYSVNLQIRDVFTDPNGRTFSTTFYEPTLVFTDHVIAPEEAFAMAADRWSESFDAGFESARGSIYGWSMRGLHVRSK